MLKSMPPKKKKLRKFNRGPIQFEQGPTEFVYTPKEDTHNIVEDGAMMPKEPMPKLNNYLNKSISTQTGEITNTPIYSGPYSVKYSAPKNTSAVTSLNVSDKEDGSFMNNWNWGNGPVQLTNIDKTSMENGTGAITSDLADEAAGASVAGFSNAIGGGLLAAGALTGGLVSTLVGPSIMEHEAEKYANFEYGLHKKMANDTGMPLANVLGFGQGAPSSISYSGGGLARETHGQGLSNVPYKNTYSQYEYGYGRM